MYFMNTKEMIIIIKDFSFYAENAKMIAIVHVKKM